jgi:hypothetical protein
MCSFSTYIDSKTLLFNACDKQLYMFYYKGLNIISIIHFLLPNLNFNLIYQTEPGAFGEVCEPIDTEFCIVILW